RQEQHRLILHSDRGSQFRSGDYQDYLAANGLLCSMSAVGHCGDKAACEGFFGLLKRERIYRTTYPALDAARSDVFEYIERRHNPRMRRRRVKQDRKFSALSKQSVISGKNPCERQRHSGAWRHPFRCIWGHPTCSRPHVPPDCKICPPDSIERPETKNPAFLRGFPSSLDFPVRRFGAGNRNRTYDLRITNAPLYQLSYSGEARILSEAASCG